MQTLHERIAELIKRDCVVSLGDKRLAWRDRSGPCAQIQHESPEPVDAYDSELLELSETWCMTACLDGMDKKQERVHLAVVSFNSDRHRSASVDVFDLAVEGSKVIPITLRRLCR